MPKHCSNTRGNPSMTPSLLELQRAMARELLSPGEMPASDLVCAQGIAAPARVAIYRNTYVSVLLAALRIAYPAVGKLVGMDFFEAAAQRYIEDHPPETAYLNAYGAQFGDFLADFEPAAALRYLPDVARLEWAVNGALHAEDRARLDPERLLRLEETEQARVCFLPHPSVTLLRCETPAERIWRAVMEQDDVALAAVDPESGPVWLLVERAASGVEVSALSEPAWLFAGLLCGGSPLQVALARAGNPRADAWLADHLAAGRLVDFTVSAPDPS